MSDEKKSESEKLCVGAITGAHGIHGEVKIKTFTELPEAIATFGKLCDERGDTSFVIRSIKPAKGGIVARIKGVDNRGAAEQLKGTALFTSRAHLPELEEGEYYYSDLLGLEVRFDDGRLFGHVKAVENFGAGDLIDVQPLEGGDTIFIPFTREIVPEIDIEAGWLTINPPEGLLE